jgi:superfamily II DNA or RNA helicase
MKLRPYQKRIVQKIDEFLISSKQRAQIYAPTGSGKTECFGNVIQDLTAVEARQLSIAIVHPRIALSQDQLSRFKRRLGTTFVYTSFHSGSHVTGSEQKREFSTTSRVELIKIIDSHSRDNGHHITFASYDSFGKIADMAFDLIIFDEAHYLVQEQFFNILDKLLATKVLFFTATPIFEEEVYALATKGMNNVDMFGDVIATVKPKELIKLGYMVAPVVHLLDMDSTKPSSSEEIDYDVVIAVAKAFKHQKEEMSKYGMPHHQMLVASSGVGDHTMVEDNLLRLWKEIGYEVPLYAIDSKYGARRNGRLQKSRADAINNIKLEKDCIVIHYDTLAEGIDIDSLSGMIMLRELSKTKLLQTMGRCARPYHEDLDTNRNIIDMSNRKKPVFVMTIPTLDGYLLGNRNWDSISTALIEGGYAELADYLDSKDRVRKNPDDANEKTDLNQDSDIDKAIAEIEKYKVQRIYKEMLAKLDSRIALWD